MNDAIVSASAPDAGFAIVSGVTTGVVREAQRRHHLSPTASAAVGRLLTGAALLGSGLKGSERISLQVSGDGPLQRVVADAWLLDESTIGARGYAKQPTVDLPLNTEGKFDVARAVGSGVLQVTKSLQSAQPYIGVVPLYSGEIAEDIASYLLNSEQIPSVVALGVLADPQGIVASGGVVARVLPGAHERTITALEQRALKMPPVTRTIARGGDAAALCRELAGDARTRVLRRMRVKFACRCSREKVEEALLALGTDELRKMARDQPQTEATCDFCRHVYRFSPQEVQNLAQRARKAV